MIDTIFMYLFIGCCVIEAISVLSLIAAAVTFVIYPPPPSRVRSKSTDDNKQ